MKRVWKTFSDAAQAELDHLIVQRCSRKPKPSPHSVFRDLHYPCHIRYLYTQTPPCMNSTTLPVIRGLFTTKAWLSKVKTKNDMRRDVSILRDKLVESGDDWEKIVRVLEDNGNALFQSHPDGSAFVELLKQLNPWPGLAVEVFNWRRNQAKSGTPLTSKEYSKGIGVAGKNKNVDLAVELFTEAANMHFRTTSTYNEMISTYMWNGLFNKCQLVFQDLKGDETCIPTIVTYNILISVFGRLMLIKHMEATFQEIKDQNLLPNLSTYNNMLVGYLRAWMWDSMEKTYMNVKERFDKQDISVTHLLMIRGYAHSGNLEKMEGAYELVKDHVNNNEIPLIRVMICAYCKSSSSDRVDKIERLQRLIPKEEYRPWLNVMLIRVYAKEDLMDVMETLINEAFEHKTSIVSAGVMRAIIAGYFRCNAIDKLTNFVKRAENAGWRICRSLYHCKMIMYGSQNRLNEMENVLSEMENFNFNISKKTCIILYKVYSSCGEIQKVQQVVGLMCRHGYGFPHAALRT